MSSFYQAVGWNRQKRIYDLTLLCGITLYLGTFVAVGAVLFPDATAETLIIRGLGTGALALLHLVLCIGPLARIDRRFLPLLYNRRHLGIATFLLGLGHAVFGVIQFHSGGDLNPLVSVLTGNPRVNELGQFPFELLGLLALVILFLMAATSHDFWLANLTAPVWKTLHMLVYLAYGLLVAHVTLGVLQAETGALPTTLMAIGLALVLGLHLWAGLIGRQGDRELAGARPGEWVDFCAVDDIEEARARTGCFGGEKLAVFRYDGKLSCVSSVCQHQNGPLGEGRVIDGLITCPWHGYQYCPDTGASPPPFSERIPTFPIRVVAGRVQIDPRPLPPGTRVEPARLAGGSA